MSLADKLFCEGTWDGTRCFRLEHKAFRFLLSCGSFTGQFVQRIALCDALVVCSSNAPSHTVMLGDYIFFSNCCRHTKNPAARSLMLVLFSLGLKNFDRRLLNDALIPPRNVPRDYLLIQSILGATTDIG